LCDSGLGRTSARSNKDAGLLREPDGAPAARVRELGGGQAQLPLLRHLRLSVLSGVVDHDRRSLHVPAQLGAGPRVPPVRRVCHRRHVHGKHGEQRADHGGRLRGRLPGRLRRQDLVLRGAHDELRLAAGRRLGAVRPLCGAGRGARVPRRGGVPAERVHLRRVAPLQVRPRRQRHLGLVALPFPAGARRPLYTAPSCCPAMQPTKHTRQMISLVCLFKCDWEKVYRVLH